FARLQLDRPALPRDGALQKVHFEVADTQHRLRGRVGGPPAERIHARREFGQRERLDEIVVTAGIEAGDEVVQHAQRAEEQDRGPDSGGADRLDDGQSIEARQHAVDDEDVVAPIGGELAARRAIGRMIDDMAEFAQPLGDVGRRIGGILDQQYLQSHLPTAARAERFGTVRLPPREVINRSRDRGEAAVPSRSRLSDRNDSIETYKSVRYRQPPLPAFALRLYDTVS